MCVHSYGPSVTTISKLLQPWIKLYIDSLKFELKENDDEFYLFYVSRNLEKGMGSSQWCSTIKVQTQSTRRPPACTQAAAEPLPCFQPLTTRAACAQQIFKQWSPTKVSPAPKNLCTHRTQDEPAK